MLDQLDTARLGSVAQARAGAREVVWAQRAELTGESFPPAPAGGRDLPGLVIDLDASVVVCHGEKECAAPTFKSRSGSIRCWRSAATPASSSPPRCAAGTRAATPPPTTSPSWQQRALLPDHHRHGTPILVRADPPGCTREFFAHIRIRRDESVSCEFSVGWQSEADRDRHGCEDGVDRRDRRRRRAPRRRRPGRDHPCASRPIADRLPPSGTRLIVRRERPHPAAQLDAFEERDGWRYTAFATDTRYGQLANLDARHRAHAGVEGRIRTAKYTGLDHVPSCSFAINATWLSVVMLALQSDRLDPAPAPARRSREGRAEYAACPLLHVGDRLTRGQRRLWLRIQRTWPWAQDLAAAFTRLAALPVPAG
ncbi:transposase [Pseudonocardia sp. 73-21]|uniref:transposase n=1 Tax=Pseudonocardia sp. 73-21 TaxID=1895809 RepID=UPI00261B6FE0|nr:transposase [Pseudonocardia sp. 73-21]